MLKTSSVVWLAHVIAYHLGEGRVLKTVNKMGSDMTEAYHLGEGRVLKTVPMLGVRLR